MEYNVSSSKESPEEVNIVVSDLHLGDGPRLRNGDKNLLEEFYHDREFAGFLTLIQEQYKNVPRVRLQLSGDIVDSQSVLFHGKSYDMPYETVGRYKIKRIMRAHPIFFDALGSFLSTPGRDLDFYKGNHDFFVEWPGVQRLILKRISGGVKEIENKIRFLDKEERLGVHYFHGHIEPHSATNYNEKYITARFGVPLKRPLLNYPYGTFLTVELTNKMKMWSPLVGRLRSNTYFWRYGLLWDWGFFIRILALYPWVFLYNRFFAPFWDVRRKAKLSTTIKIMLWSIFGHDLTEYARRIFEQNPAIKVVICGHDHEAMRVTISRGPDSGTYINTGTWTRCYDIVEEAIVLTWKRWASLERLWIKVKNFFSKPRIVAAEKLTFALVEHFSDGAMNARLMEFRPYAPHGKKIRELL